VTKALHELLSGSWIRLFLLKEPAGPPWTTPSSSADSVRPRHGRLHAGCTAPGMNRRAGCVPTPGSSAMQRPGQCSLPRTPCNSTHEPSPLSNTGARQFRPCPSFKSATRVQRQWPATCVPPRVRHAARVARPAMQRSSTPTGRGARGAWRVARGARGCARLRSLELVSKSPRPPRPPRPAPLGARCAGRRCRQWAGLILCVPCALCRAGGRQGRQGR